jgi:hypothetical protein
VKTPLKGLILPAYFSEFFPLSKARFKGGLGTLPPMQKTKIAMLLATLLTVAGCATGFDAATQSQQPTGNGRYLNVGDLQVQNLVIVQGETDSALLMKIFNSTDQADRLTQLLVAGKPVLSDIEIAANQILAYGNAANPPIRFGNLGRVGTYISVQLEFERAGIYETTALVVPPTGQYEGLVN